MDQYFRHSIPVKREIILFILLFGLAVFLRFYHLAADPPQGITFSQGIETDPPQYTVFARNDVLQNDWNPYNDDRYVTYQYSLISIVSRGIYGLFGTGTYQCNLIAALVTILTLILFYFVSRKIIGNSGALLTLFFIGINYLQIFFGRRPFLEVGMNFLFILGLFCLTLWEKKTFGHFFWGLFTAAAIVFGKVIGLAFLAAPGAYYLYRLLYLKDQQAFKDMAAMVTGFIVCVGAWYVFVFSPHAASVTGYVGEQAFGLYGTPEGLQSLTRFVWKFLAFGIDSEFFNRMPAISIAAAATVVFLASYLFPGRRVQKQDRFHNTALIAIAAWLVGIYFAQMPWNYQPVRYQISLVFPLAVLTSAGIIYLARRKAFNALNRSLIFSLIAFVVLMLVVYQITGAVVDHMGLKFYFTKYVFFVFGFVGPLMLIYFIVSRRKEQAELALPGFVRYWLIGMLICTSLIYNARNYLTWAATPLYTCQKASEDLGQILSPAAVISGPFGPALTMDNTLGCIIHIFGTSRPDSLLFQKYPITHLALEKSNEAVARELYPEIMDRADKICSYYVDCRKITIYRIAFFTGNPEARKYFLSGFEQAISFYGKGILDSADFYLDRFNRIYPDNESGYKQGAYKSIVLKEFDSAIDFAQKAVAFSPTDFSLHYLLSNAYIEKAIATENDSLMELGRKSRERATVYNLGYVDFDDEYGNELEQDSLNESGSDEK